MARPKRTKSPKRASSPQPPAQEKGAGRPAVLPWLEGLGLAGLAALVNFYRLTAQSFWADEGNSIAQAMRPVPEIVVRAAMDIHPPLYYVLLHAWTRVFGLSEFAIRSLSALAGIAVVVLTWALARRLWGAATARVAGVIAALHPALVYYSQEARMYAFIALWASLAGYALITIILREGRARLALSDTAPASNQASTSVPRLQRVPPSHPALLLGRWDALFVLAMAAGMWTHYMFGVMAGVFALVYLAWIWNTRRTIPVYPRLIRVLTDNLAVLLLFMPWLPIALQRLQSWPRPSAPLGPAAALNATWQWLTTGPVTPPYMNRWLWFWATLVLVALWPWRRAGRRPHWLSWGLPVLWVALPPAVMIVAGVMKPAYLKFLIISVPPFVILLARGVLAPWEAWRWTKHKGRWVAGGWLVGSLLVLLTLQTLILGYYYYDPAAARDDYRGIARYIEAVETPGDAIILNAPGQWDVFRYYYKGSLPVYRLPEERPPDAKRLTARLTSIAQQHGKLFVILWATNESDPTGIMESWLDTHAYKALDVWRGNVRFLIYATMRTSESDAAVYTMDAQLGNAVRLERAAVWNTRVAPGDVVQVRLHWRARAPLSRRYKVFLQLLAPGDRLIAQRDTEPVGGERPTTSWQPNEEIEDNYGLLIPLATPPGTYRLIAGMYDASTGERLPVQQGERRGDFIEFPVQITVTRPRVPPPEEVLPIRYRVDVSVGPVRLLGYNRYKRGFRHQPDTPIRPGDFLHVTVYWQAVEAPRDRWRMTLALVDGWGNTVAHLTDDLAGAEYPTTEWAANEVVRGEFDLYVPPDVRPNTYGLRVQLWRGDTPAGDPIPLGTVEISP